MGRKIIIHVCQDGRWVPVGEAYVDTPTFGALKRIADDQEILVGLITKTEEERTDASS